MTGFRKHQKNLSRRKRAAGSTGRMGEMLVERAFRNFLSTWDCQGGLKVQRSWRIDGR